MNITKLKKEHNSYFVIYTLLFVMLSIIFFYKFWEEGISFVWETDGWNQHIRATQFYSNWLQQIVKNIFIYHKWEIPLWSSCIGFGSDIITTLHYYVVGDPLNLLYVFVPDYYIAHFYDFMMLFRIYMAGISFSLFCFYRKNDNKIAVITGSILYMFSTYIIIFGFHHPFFINPFIYLPLLFIGIEKILEDRSPFCFIFMVFVSTISSFYFMYMIALNAVMYLIIRLIAQYGIKDIKNLILKLIYFALNAVAGLCMGGIILLPIMNLFSQNSREGSTPGFQLLYEKDFYQKLPRMITAYNKGVHHTILVLSCIIIFSVYLLYTKRKQNTELKVSFILLTLCLCSPIMGKIFNGFSYPSNRWMFGYILLLSYIVVVEWDELFQMSWKRFCGLAVIIFILASYAYDSVPDVWKAELKIYYILLGAGLVFTGIFAVFNQLELSKNKIIYNCMQTVVVILAVTSVSLNIYKVFYAQKDKPNHSAFVSVEKVRKKLVSNADRTALKASKNDKSFFRYEPEKLIVKRNSTLQSGLNSTNFYWSLADKLPGQFFTEMGLTNKQGYNYHGLDARTILNELACTKYYVTKLEQSGKEVVPFGFEKIGENKTNGVKYSFFKNSYALPIGYTYDSYYSRSDYEAMSEIERQSSLLQGVLLEKECPNYSKTQISQNYSEIPYEISQCDGVEIHGDTFEVKKNKGSIQLETKKEIKNSEVNLFVRDVQKEQSGKVIDDDMNRSAYEVRTVNSDGRTTQKVFYYLQPNSLRYCGKTKFLVNLGYFESGRQTISLKFPKRGSYKIGTLKVYAQSMEQYPEQVSRLKENVLENVKIGTNTIQGNINLKKNKILCLSVPYSKGWTAVVDGKKQEILQANTMYMALTLTKGEHKIQLSYCTPGLKPGIAVSFVGVGMCIIICSQKKRNKGKHNK